MMERNWAATKGGSRYGDEYLEVQCKVYRQMIGEVSEEIMKLKKAQLFVGFDPFFSFKVEETEDKDDADKGENRFYFIETMGELGESFTHLKTDIAKDSGTNEKGNENGDIEFNRLKFKAATEGGDKRDGDDGNDAGNENEEFIINGFFEIRTDFFDELPGNTDMSSKLINEGFTTKIGGEKDERSANGGTDGIGK